MIDERSLKGSENSPLSRQVTIQPLVIPGRTRTYIAAGRARCAGSYPNRCAKGWQMKSVS